MRSQRQASDRIRELALATLQTIQQAYQARYDWFTSDGRKVELQTLTDYLRNIDISNEDIINRFNQAILSQKLQTGVGGHENSVFIICLDSFIRQANLIIKIESLPNSQLDYTKDVYIRNIAIRTLKSIRLSYQDRYVFEWFINTAELEQWN